MRRTLEVISLGLFLIGLELSVGTLSLTISRLREMGADPIGTNGPETIEWRNLGGLVLMALAVLLAGLSVVARFGTKTIQKHEGCAKCGARTKRIRRTPWQRLLSRLLGKKLTARHCGGCGWKGLSYTH